MFYFDNTFYVDTSKGAEDYSEGIRKWASERGIFLGETVSMKDMKVEDLELRFGYPYVFKHQGLCEHLIILSDARYKLTNLFWNKSHDIDYLWSTLG